MKKRKWKRRAKCTERLIAHLKNRLIAAEARARAAQADTKSMQAKLNIYKRKVEELRGD
jgi:hypothetical protein